MKRLFAALLFTLFASVSSAQILINCATGTPCTNNGPTNTGTGDNLPTAGTKINANFTAMPSALFNGLPLPQSAGGTGGASLAAANIPVQSGSITSGHCVEWISGISIGDSGAACGSGGGGNATQVNGASVPTSAVHLGSNSSGQLISVPAAQLSSSSSLLTASISPSAQDRYPLFAGQEASVFLNGGIYNVLYTDGSGYTGWRYCNGDPTQASCWSAETVVIGNSIGGQTGVAKHGFTFFDPSTPGVINQYYVDSSNNTDVATATMPGAGTTAPTFTKVGTVLAVQGGNNGQGNMAVLYYSGTYYLWQESLNTTTNPTEGTTHSWQIGVFTSSTSTGTFTVSVATLNSLRSSPNAANGGPFVEIVNGTPVMIYHCQSWGRLVVSDICRATTTLGNLATDNWTLTNGGAGTASNPINPLWAHRAQYYEYDQLADPTIFTGPNGVQYMMYTGAKNTTTEGSNWYEQMITPLFPGSTQVDGSYIHNIYGYPGERFWYWNPGIPDSYTNLPLTSVTVSSSGTWSVVNNSSQNGGVLYTNTSAASSDTSVWRATLLPGTYKLTVNYATGPGNGIAEFQLDDCYLASTGNIVTIDGYTASAAYNASVTGTLYVLGYEPLKGCVQMNVDSKNASSSGYQLQISGFSLQRTGN